MVDNIEKAKQFMLRSQKDPAFFIKKIRNLDVITQKEDFIKFKTLTHQQSQIVEAVKKAVNGEASWKISIRSGHGIGKSTIIAILVIRFLFCHKDAQIPTTAPTAPQLQDILRKEIASWIRKMPEGIKEMFDLTSDYLRIKGNEETWFARARTGKKENPEALAGVHSDHVLLLADEASGVADEVYDASKGSLTGKNKLFILIGNPTRLTGYFYKTQTQLEDRQKLHFSSAESPIVDQEFLDTIIKEHGIDSDEYRIRVLGEFPRADAIDSKGFIPLLLQQDLRITEHYDFNPLYLGVDVAGEGKDETIRVIRDYDTAKIIAREKISTPLGVAKKTALIMNEYGISEDKVNVDFFGIGSSTVVELAKLGHNVNGINVGDKANDSNRFINIRAEASRELKEWLSKGGKLIYTRNKKDRDDCLMIKYRRELSGKIKVMSKEDMRKEYGKSPDVFDALMLTFCGNQEKENIDFNKIITTNRRA